MKKHIVLLFMLLAGTVAMAQTCPFNVVFKTIDATCYNNGKVVYALVDGSKNPMSVIPEGMSDVRIYYKFSENDSAHYHGFYQGGWDTMTIDYGDYIVGVEAVCSNVNGGFLKKDTNIHVTINTSYNKPSVSALHVTSSSSNSFGKIPSLYCAETGRIQLKIENGKFPYVVAVKQRGNDNLYRTVVFDTNQYNGTSPTSFNYKDYYSIDSLPAGNWDFYVVDGCEYGLPRVTESVSTVNFPNLSSVSINSISEISANKSVVKIIVALDNNTSYYSSLLPLFAKYRIRHVGETEISWKPFPMIASGNSFTFLDTITVDNSDCEFWNQDIFFDYQVNGCGSLQSTKSAKLSNTMSSDFEKQSSNVTDTVITEGSGCDERTAWHTKSYQIRCKDDTKIHYTQPIVWIYTDRETNQIIKRDTINTILSWSYLYDYEVENLYRSFKETPLTVKVERKIQDINGCNLYSFNDDLIYRYDTSGKSTSWNISYSGSDNCCQTQRYVSVSQSGVSKADLNGTTIKLVRSPYNNRYNFEAVYNSVTKKWEISKSSLENTADIVTGNEGTSVSLQDYCLPSGPYRFEVESTCGSYIIEKEIAFADVHSSELIEEPAYTHIQQCTERHIVYTSGMYARKRSNTSPVTGLDIPAVYDTLPTYFQVISGPVGGYDALSHPINDPIRISMPGKYVVRISPSSSLALCDLPYLYDTVVYEGATVEFDYVSALLCDVNSSVGDINIKGINGTEPYTYTLYDSTNKLGNIIATNTTGVFTNLPMSLDKEMSCMIKDACDAYFHVNFFPFALAKMQKVWFDDGLTMTTTCEGSTIKVNALEIGSILEYEWTGPNGFIDSVSKPFVFIPREADTGWYKVNIKNTGCSGDIVDSIFLRINKSPVISMSHDTVVCPGSETEIFFIPESPLTTASITFTMAFENADGVESQTFTAHSGEKVTYRYSTNTAAKIYPISIDDGRCNYQLADAGDTLFISMRTDLANSCNILTTYDTLCYGGGAHLTAKAQVETPYTLRWFADYTLQELRKEEIVTDDSYWSYYDTFNLTERTFMYVSVEKDNVCPTVHGISTNTMNMQSGSTVLDCNKVVRLYDSGGPDSDYSAGEMIKHTFRTTDGQPVTIKFQNLELSNTSHLFIISGEEPLIDSVLFDITSGSEYPEIIVSNGNTLTLYFMSGMMASGGWSALVEHTPGMAMADVWKENKVTITDEVCRSQTNNYDDPYNIAPDIVSSDVLDEALRKEGKYTYTKTLPNSDVHGCDSTVTFVLTVNYPPISDTTVVTTNMHGGSYTWHDSTYTVSGQYGLLATSSQGCDSILIMNLIILQIDTSDNNVCKGESTVMGITVTEPEMIWHNNEDVLPMAQIGDILCTDSTILKPDSFLVSGKTAKGIIFYVDKTGVHGLAVSPSDVYSANLQWAPYSVGSINSLHDSVHSLTSVNTILNAISDMNGYANTLEIKRTAESASVGTFKTNAPAAYYCYYYNHVTCSLGTVHQGWFLPSAGQLNLLHANRGTVNRSLKKLAAKNSRIKILDNSKEYWTSTESFTSAVWHISSAGHITTNSGAKSKSRPVRAVLAF